jgi:hypothetical protein
MAGFWWAFNFFFFFPSFLSFFSYTCTHHTYTHTHTVIVTVEGGGGGAKKTSREDQEVPVQGCTPCKSLTTGKGRPTKMGPAKGGSKGGCVWKVKIGIKRQKRI